MTVEKEAMNDFQNRKKMAVYKPSLMDVVLAVKEKCKSSNISLPFFNIEIKSLPEGDDIFHPKPTKFAKILLAEIKRLEIESLTCIQSFDVRSIQAVKKTSA